MMSIDVLFIFFWSFYFFGCVFDIIGVFIYGIMVYDAIRRL